MTAAPYTYATQSSRTTSYMPSFATDEYFGTHDPSHRHPARHVSPVMFQAEPGYTYDPFVAGSSGHVSHDFRSGYPSSTYGAGPSQVSHDFHMATLHRLMGQGRHR